jgi:hypothetical protein
MAQPRTAWSLVFVSFFLFISFFQTGCGGGTKPPEAAPADSHSKTKKSEPKFANLNLPRETMAEIEKNIKDWVTKKAFTIQRDKGGAVVVKNGKGRKVKVPASCIPTNDKLSKEAIEMIEGRVKEWAAAKNFTTDRNKKGKLVGKNAKGKNVGAPFEVFISVLPDSLAPGGASADTGKASDTAEPEEDSGEDGDADE